MKFMGKRKYGKEDGMDGLGEDICRMGYIWNQLETITQDRGIGDRKG